MNPVIPTKNTGDTFSAIECNSVVAAIQSKVDSNVFSTYAALTVFLTGVGVTSDVYQCVVLSDEQNNGGNLTNYTYTNGILNWVATQPVTI